MTVINQTPNEENLEAGIDSAATAGESVQRTAAARPAIVAEPETATATHGSNISSANMGHS